MLVAETLRAIGPAKTKREAEKNVVAAVDLTAKRLGNTRSVCRKYYIHPALIASYLDGGLELPRAQRRGLSHHEASVLAFLTRKPKRRAGALR